MTPVEFAAVIAFAFAAGFVVGALVAWEPGGAQGWPRALLGSDEYHPPPDDSDDE